MRHMRFLACLLALSAPELLAQQAAAQPPPQRDPQAVAVLQQGHAVAAGTGSSVQDVVAQGQITWADGTVGTITLKAKGAERLRHEIERSAKQMTYVVSSGKGYGVQDGKRRELPLWVTAYQRPEFIPAFSRLGDYSRPDMNLAYLGAKDVEGRPAHHIRLTAAASDGIPEDVAEIISEFHLFVDVETRLVVKTEGHLFSPEIIENRSPVETYFSDYRSVDGLLIPHRVVRYVSGQKESEITITSVRVNAGLADSDFQ